MKKTLTLLSMAASLLTLGACSQMPTEQQGRSDSRPQISFKAYTDRILSAKVVLDGRDVGPVGSYLEGAASLRIHPGNHMLIVASENRLIFQQKFYADDGVNRIFTVN
jgi:hypothetical protein